MAPEAVSPVLPFYAALHALRPSKKKKVKRK